MTQRMTPKERYMAGIRRQAVDRPPVGSPTSVATVAQMELLGARFPDVHRDGQAMAQLAAGAHTVLGYDAIMPIFSVIQESAALGCPINWGSFDSMPAVERPIWSEPEQVSLPADLLIQPTTAAVLDAIGILKREHGERVAIIGKVMGPWTLAYHVYGIQRFLADTLLDPDRVHRWLDALQEITRCFAHAQIDAGIDLLCLADHATGDLVRGTMYRDFLRDRHARMIEEFDCPTVLHICGDTLDRIPFIVDAGFDAFHFESKVDAQAAIGAASDRMSLIGNVNNPQTLLQGTPEQVAEQARYAMDAGVRVLAPECAIPLYTPIENLKAIAAVAAR